MSLFQNQETSLDVSLKDNTGRSILLDFPRIKFSGGRSRGCRTEPGRDA